MGSSPAEFECELSAEAYPYLGQYEVDGRPALPAAAALEFAVAGVASVLDSGDGFELHEIHIADPIPFAAHTIELAALIESGAQSGRFQIALPGTANQRTLARGRFAPRSAASTVSAWSERAQLASGEMQGEECSVHNIALGAAYLSALRRVVASDSSAIASLDRDSSARNCPPLCGPRRMAPRTRRRVALGLAAACAEARCCVR